MRNLIFTLLALILPFVGFAQDVQPQYRSSRSNDIARLHTQTVHVIDAPTSVTTTLKTFTGAQTLGSSILGSGVTIKENGGRTLAVAFTEADSDNPTIIVDFEGRHGVFDFPVTERFTFTGTGIVLGEVPFGAVTDVIFVSGVTENTDTLKVDKWGFGLEGDPQSYRDVLLCTLDGTKEVTQTVFPMYYIPATAAWQPFVTEGEETSNVAAEDILVWRTRTTSIRGWGPHRNRVSEPAEE